MISLWNKILAFTLFTCLMLNCGEELSELNPLAEKIDQSETLALLPTLKGYIQTTYGSSNDFHQWKLFLMQKESLKGYITNIQSKGNFEFTNIESEKLYSLYLFNPDFQIAAILVIKPKTPGKLARYFEITEERLPFLVVKGQTMVFSESSKLAIDESYLINDGDDNDIPDDMAGFWSLTSPEDKLFLEQEFDRDRDGISNGFDDDDDNDEIKDVLDADSNNDSLADLRSKRHDQFFPSEITLFTTNLKRIEQSEGSFVHELTLIARARAGLSLSSIKVLGPESVLANAIGIKIDDQGNPQDYDFDQSLFDDGSHFDMAAKDGVYGARIRLAGSLPRRFHTIFVEVEYQYLDLDADGNELVKSHRTHYGRTLPSIPFGNISAAVNAALELSVSGDPFPGVGNYQWSCSIFDDQGRSYYQSANMEADASSLLLPREALPTDLPLTFEVVAITMERLLGYPSHSIHSARYPLPLGSQ